MRSYKAFLNKEIIENTRNFKILILCLVFLAIGFSNPIIAKLTPELLASSGLDIKLPEPTIYDSWVQFYKNIGTQLFLFVVLFSTIFSNEIKSGSIINMVTKGLSRRTIIYSKFSFLFGLWTIAYAITFLTTYLYSPLLLEGSVGHVITASLYPWLFGLLMIGISGFGAVVSKQMIGGLIAPLIFIVTCSMLGLVESISEYSPMQLLSGSLGLLNDSVEITNFTSSAIIAVLLMIIVIEVAVQVFNRQFL